MQYFTSPIIDKIRNEDQKENFKKSFNYIEQYYNNVDQKRVFPSANDLAELAKIDSDLNTYPIDSSTIIDELTHYVDIGAVSTTGSRYFGFVTGGILPAALHSRLIADCLDQNSALFLMSPLASTLEELTQEWMIEILDLPKNSAMGVVTGSASATILALNAAMYKINKNDRSKIKAVISKQAHATVFKSLKILGVTSQQITMVDFDKEGCIDKEKIPPLDENTILILQAANVNTGGYDDFNSICPKTKEQGAWIHIDGAFGLYANSCLELKHLTKGIELADSWTVDAHKTLNSPYDNGLVICRDKENYLESLKVEGSYLVASTNRDGMHYTMEMSRRARSIDLWATIKSLGKVGISELVYEMHHKALYFSNELRKINIEILNDVVFNQVLIHYKDDDTTKTLQKKINESGVCFMSSSVWDNKFVIRISVSSYKTTYNDIDCCLEKIKEIVKEL